MPQEIYNEGRVVGLSAWEIFEKTALGNGVPIEDIPAEPKWLASMIGSGASVILKIPANTPAGVTDFELPSGSSLSAAGVIVASPFMGDCAWDADTNTWATKVTSYSPLIQNTSSNNPPSQDGKVPYDNTYSTTEYVSSLSEFLKITDGIVYTKNATWIQTPDAEPGVAGTPYKDINPNFNSSTSVVRLYFSTAIKYETKVLLTGFQDKVVLQTLCKAAYASGGRSVGGSTDVDLNDWKNGGMLGPEVFPWASKIIFTVPSSAYSLVNSLTRTITSDATYSADSFVIGPGSDDSKKIHLNNIKEAQIRVNSIIDFNSINLVDYYNIHASEYTVASPTLSENVLTVASGSGDSSNQIVAWYPGMTAANVNAESVKSPQTAANFFPPAIYAAQINEAGSQTLIPLDIAAPGTVKGFTDATQAYNYKMLMPNNYAIYYNANNDMYSFVVYNESDSTNWPGTGKIAYISGDYPKAEVTLGNVMAGMITLTDANGDYYGNAQGVLDGSGGTAVVGPENNPTWDTLLKSLKNNNQVDILGTKLHNLGTELKTSNTIGVTNNVTESGADKFTLTGSTPVSMTSAASSGTNEVVLESGTSIKSGTNFIEFSNGKRLYISNTDPGTTNVPEGSIGIGW